MKKQPRRKTAQIAFLLAPGIARNSPRWMFYPDQIFNLDEKKTLLGVIYGDPAFDDPLSLHRAGRLYL